MNKRIKDFSKQSKEHAEALFPDHTKFNHSENWHEAYHNKFAELIVKECMAQCADNGSNDEWDKGVRWAAAQIKQHFGVEE